jgi:hypothetical protein
VNYFDEAAAIEFAQRRADGIPGGVKPFGEL